MIKYLFIFASFPSLLFAAVEPPSTNAVFNSLNSVRLAVTESNVDSSELMSMLTDIEDDLTAINLKLFSGNNPIGLAVNNIRTYTLNIQGSVNKIVSNLLSISNNVNRITECVVAFQEEFWDYEETLWFYLGNIMDSVGNIDNNIDNIANVVTNGVTRAIYDLLSGSNIVVTVNPVISNVTLQVMATNAIPITWGSGGGSGDAISATLIDLGDDAKDDLVEVISNGVNGIRFGITGDLDLFHWKHDLFSDSEWHDEYMEKTNSQFSVDPGNFYTALLQYQSKNLELLDTGNKGIYRILAAFAEGRPVSDTDVENVYSSAKDEADSALDEFEQSTLGEEFTFENLFGQKFEPLGNKSTAIEGIQSDVQFPDSVSQVDFTIQSFEFMGNTIETLGGDLMVDCEWLGGFIEFMRGCFLFFYGCILFLFVLRVAFFVVKVFNSGAQQVTDFDVKS